MNAKLIIAATALLATFGLSYTASNQALVLEKEKVPLQSEVLRSKTVETATTSSSTVLAQNSEEQIRISVYEKANPSVVAIY